MHYQMIKKLFLFVAALFGVLSSVKAGNETFTVCTYNVDGLPDSITVMGVKVALKKDGAGESGSVKIGKYLSETSYDLIGVNEDFQYHNSLLLNMGDKYDCGTWQGGIDIPDSLTIFQALLLIPFKTDGLNLFWKKGIKAEDEKITTFTNAYGLIDHENDSLVTKGFRYYKVTLATGTEVDMYITHMDASVNLDDAEDIRVRRIQLKQIADAINENHNGRPIIFMGDTNCNYQYDDVNGLLLDAINNEGEKTITDVCTYMDPSGKDIWDKVFFINYKTGKQIRPIKYYVDGDVKLSDHDPVAVTFEVTDSSTGIESVSDADIATDQISAVYSPSGTCRKALQPGVNIVQMRSGRVVKVVKR